jgi:uncharacterized protein (DUF58 family)
MKKRLRTILCRESLYYLAVVGFVFGAAMVKEMNLLVLMTGMLLGPLLVSWRSGLVTLRGLQLRRRMPHGVSAGDLLAVSIDVTSKRRFSGSWAITVEDQIHREGTNGNGVLRPNVWVSYLGGRQSCTQVYRGRLPRRGRYHFGPLTASTRFPFGLLRRSHTVAAADTLLVYPRLGRLTRAWNVWHQEAVEGARRRERRQGRASGEFFGVREWHRGDNRRWIHWRSSAKHNTLVVRQFEQRRSRDFAILLDLWQAKQPTPEQADSVELAVSFAATLVATICRQETNHLLLGLTGQTPDWLQGPVSALLREDAMQRLALVEPSHEARLVEMLDEALDRIEAGTQVVLVSTRANDLRDGEQFGALCTNAHRRMLLRQIRTVDTSDPGLAEYFQVD